MNSYDVFAKFYDAIVGNRADVADFLDGVIQERNPEAKTVLELACGTGEVLKELAAFYDVSGLDISPGMLKIARQKLPDAQFYHQSMAGFKLDQKFDVIICMFDSVNHLTDFEDWEQTFASAAAHLAQGGLFIFDVNTEHKLAKLASERPLEHSFEPHTLIADVTNESGIYHWNMKVLEHVEGAELQAHEESIREAVFPQAQIEAALAQHFSQIKVLDVEADDPSKANERLHFICQIA